MEEKKTENIYPSLDHTDENLLIDKISTQRANIITQKVESLEKELTHYKKLKKRWSKISSKIRIFGTTIGSVLTIGGCIIAGIATQGIAIPFVIPIILSSVGTVQIMSSEVTAFTFVKNKKNKYQEKCDLYNKIINRLYHFYHIALEDKKVCVEEMNEFYKIIDQFEADVNQQNIKHESEFDKIKVQAQKEAKKELDSEYLTFLKCRFKEEEKEKLQTLEKLN